MNKDKTGKTIVPIYCGAKLSASYSTWVKPFFHLHTPENNVTVFFVIGFSNFLLSQNFGKHALLKVSTMSKDHNHNEIL